MSTQTNTTVRMFGALHTLRRDRGLQSTTEVHIPPSGCAACDLAATLDLPLEKIEAVFVNHRAHGLDHPIQAGDRVAFVPTGVPGPERVLLGIYKAGRTNRQNLIRAGGLVKLRRHCLASHDGRQRGRPDPAAARQEPP